MRDFVTYEALAERRPVRRYVVVGGVLIFGLALLLGWVGWLRMQTSSAQAARSSPSAAAEASLMSPVNLSVESIPPAACPMDPASWTLQPVFPGDRSQRLGPDCVVAGLERVVAWHLLARLGYTKPEAAARLGFETLPWEPQSVIQGVPAIPLAVDWAPHPSFRTWTLDAHGEPGLVYSLRGCWRTELIYPVVCLTAFDRAPGWVVHELADRRFTVDLTDSPPQRKFAAFGYTGRDWVLLGEPRGWQIILDHPDSAHDERIQAAAWYGTVPWDAAWLAETFNLDMQPLPAGWESFGAEPAAVQAITEALDQALLETGGLR
jgi:hypothetical protein